jgi:hypothetical protein
MKLTEEDLFKLEGPPEKPDNGRPWAVWAGEAIAMLLILLFILGLVWAVVGTLRLILEV